MLSKTKKLVLGLLFLFPLILFAQTVQGTIEKVQDILNLIIPMIMAIALIYFFIGLVKYIMAAGDDEAKGAGRSIMINGVIALFVMTAVWGLVIILGNTFLSGASDPLPPTIPGV